MAPNATGTPSARARVGVLSARLSARATASAHPKPKWNPWEGLERLGCDADIRVLVGRQVEQLLTMPMPRGGVTTMCRASVGSEYIRKSLRAASPSKFALVAMDKRTGMAVGFALCSTYNSFAGGRTASKVPVTQRIVMLDLICTSAKCSGLGKAMVRALIDVSKRQLGATLLMLEATNRAVGFYYNFGFRRVPDACAWPSDLRLQQARKAFQQASWDKALTRSDVVSVRVPGKKTRKRVTYPSFKDAAAYDKGVGNVWWTHYNRRDNGTVIMSLCLGRPTPGATFPVAWSDLTAAQLMAQDKATTRALFTRTSEAGVTANVSRYGMFQPPPPKTKKAKTVRGRATKTTTATRAKPTTRTGAKPTTRAKPTTTATARVTRAAAAASGYALRRRR